MYVFIYIYIYIYIYICVYMHRRSNTCAQVLAEATLYARDLANERADVCHPEALAAAAAAAATEHGLECVREGARLLCSDTARRAGFTASRCSAYCGP